MRRTKIKFHPLKCFDFDHGSYVFSSGRNYLIALKRKYYENLKAIEENDFVSEMCDDQLFLEECEQNGLIDHEEERSYALEDHIRHLVLMIAQDCNLNCLYCYGKSGEYQNRGKMSFGLARKAIDYLVDHRGNHHQVYVVFFGGEPFMNVNLIYDLIDYMEDIENAIDIKFGKSITTNGTLLTDEIVHYCEEKRISIRISIDGSEKTNDKYRVFKGGAGSYQCIMEKTAALRKKKAVTARATITPYNLDQDQIEESLRNEGFCSVGSAFAHELFGNEDYMRAYKYLSLGIDKTRKLIDEKKYDMIKLNQIGFFGYLLNIHQSKEADFGCGAGRKMIAVNINGDIYPCQRFVGVEEHKLGNIYADELNQRDFLDKTYIHSSQRAKCKKCWIRKLCLGTCPHNNYVNTGKVTENSEFTCVFYRTLYEDAVRFYTTLTDEEKRYIFD
jgi:uncharacterized protein